MLFKETVFLFKILEIPKEDKNVLVVETLLLSKTKQYLQGVNGLKKKESQKSQYLFEAVPVYEILYVPHRPLRVL